jgi:hypothetical protein
MSTSGRRGQGRRRPHAQRAGRYQPSSRAHQYQPSSRVHGVGNGGRTGGGGGRRKGPAVLIGTAIFLLIIIGIAVQAAKGTPAGNTSPAPAIIPTQTIASINTGTGTAATTETTVATSQAAAPTQAAPSTSFPTTPAAAPTSAAVPAGCSPLSDEGTCYEPGEYCRDSDHGASGVAGDGEAITCEDNDGWRWEPS